MKVPYSYVLLAILCLIEPCKGIANKEQFAKGSNAMKSDTVSSNYISFRNVLVYKNTQLPTDEQQIEEQDAQVSSIASNVRLSSEITDSNVLGVLKKGTKVSLVYKIAAEKRDWLFAVVNSEDIDFKKEKPDERCEIGVWLSSKTVITDKIISMTEEELNEIKGILKEQVRAYYNRAMSINKERELWEEENPDNGYSNEEGDMYDLRTFLDEDIIPSMLVKNERMRKAGYVPIPKEQFIQKLEGLYHLDFSKVLNEKHKYNYWIGFENSGFKLTLTSEQTKRDPNMRSFEGVIGGFINIDNSYVSDFEFFESLLYKGLKIYSHDEYSGLEINEFMNYLDKLSIEDLTADLIDLTEIYRNKYLFNDNKSLLPKLLMEDYRFLSMLVSGAGYTGDKKLVKGVLTSSNRNFSISKCIFSAHWLPSPHINEEMIDLVVDFEDRDLNKGLPFSSSLYESVNSSIDMLTYRDFSTEEREEIYKEIAVSLSTMWRIEKAIMVDTELSTPPHRVADILIDHPELLERLKEKAYYGQVYLKEYVEEEYPKALSILEGGR